MDKQMKDTLDVVAVVLNDVKADIDAKIAGLDPTALTKSVTVERQAQLKASILAYADNFVNQRSDVIKGEAPGVVQKVLQ